MLRLRGLVALAAVFLSACPATLGGPSPAPTFTERPKVVQGEPHRGDPAVVYLTSATRAFCTGSLIAPRVVLTARHCVEGERPQEVAIGVGPDHDEGRVRSRVQRIRTPPPGSTADPTDSDIALLILESTIDDITPYDWVRTDPAARVGDPIVGIGYGESEREDTGTKRRGESRVLGIASRTFDTGALSCYGDSGGPGFLADGRIWGVVQGDLPEGVEGDPVADSVEGSEECHRGGRWVRTDAHRSLIEQALREAADPDLDVECARLGDAGECAGGDGETRRWCDPLGNVRELHCLSGGPSRACRIDECGDGARCCPIDDGIPDPDPECGALRGQPLLCADASTVIVCDAGGRVQRRRCPEGWECDDRLPDGCWEPPPPPAPPAPECVEAAARGAYWPVGLGCGGGDDQLLRYCDDAGQVREVHCIAEEGGKLCEADGCRLGPWCCGHDDPIDDALLPPDRACGAARAAYLRCEGDELIEFCDEYGHIALFTCGDEVCRVDACASGPACCPAATPIPPPAAAGDTACSDDCVWRADGECDDGAPGSLTSACPYGADCTDCGPRPSAPCVDTCAFAFDGECDDGGPGSVTPYCALGTDCADCGPRS